MPMKIQVAIDKIFQRRESTDAPFIVGEPLCSSEFFKFLAVGYTGKIVVRAIKGTSAKVGHPSYMRDESRT